MKILTTTLKLNFPSFFNIFADIYPHFAIFTGSFMLTSCSNSIHCKQFHLDVCFGEWKLISRKKYELYSSVTEHVTTKFPCPCVRFIFAEKLLIPTEVLYFIGLQRLHIKMSAAPFASYFCDLVWETPESSIHILITLQGLHLFFSMWKKIKLFHYLQRKCIDSYFNITGNISPNNYRRIT